MDKEKKDKCIECIALKAKLEEIEEGYRDLGKAFANNVKEKHGTRLEADGLRLQLEAINEKMAAMIAALRNQDTDPKIPSV